MPAVLFAFLLIYRPCVAVAVHTPCKAFLNYPLYLLRLNNAILRFSGTFASTYQAIRPSIHSSSPPLHSLHQLLLHQAPLPHQIVHRVVVPVLCVWLE